MGPLIAFHVTAGAIGLLSGATAIVAPKGRRLHRAAGQVFLVSMLIMGGLGAGMAAMVPDRITTLAGSLTVYLVATGWMAARRPAGQIGRFETAGLVLATALALAGLSIGLIGAQLPRGRIDGLPFQAALVFGTVAAIAAVSDFRTLRRGGVAGPSRQARHLWRLSAALVIAASAFFMGQQKVMPHVMRGSPLLYLPVLAPLLLMLFWLVRVRLPRRLTSSAS
jgi:uncharacterized membrane protein